MRPPVLDAEAGQPLLQFFGAHAGSAETGQVAFGIGEEHRHAGQRDLLRHALQAHRLAGAGGAGDQTVAVGELRQQGDLGSAAFSDGKGVDHGGNSGDAKICDFK